MTPMPAVDREWSEPARGRHELRRWRRSATLRILTPIPAPRVDCVQEVAWSGTGGEILNQWPAFTRAS